MEYHKFKVDEKIKITIGKDSGKEVIIIEIQPGLIYKTIDPETKEILYYSEAYGLS